MSQEQYADLQKYIPESDLVRLTFEEIHGGKIDDWDKELSLMIEQALAGDKDKLFELLELTFLNAHNEGFLDGIEETGHHPA